MIRDNADIILAGMCGLVTLAALVLMFLGLAGVAAVVAGIGLCAVVVLGLIFLLL